MAMCSAATGIRRSCPWVVLATIATIIASQSIITGAFLMTRQAIQLGWLPRLQITQTSAEGYGEIYVGSVNWLLMLVTLGLTVGFGKSDNLASGYGIAVSATMLMTSVLLFTMREIGASLRRARSPASSCLSMRVLRSELREGGPRWIRAADPGCARLRRHAHLACRCDCALYPSPGCGYARRSLHGEDRGGVRFVCAWHCGLPDANPAGRAAGHGVARQAQPRALHEKLFVLTVDAEPVPWVKDTERLTFEEIAPRFWRAS